jgi:hypothetical protein
LKLKIAFFFSVSILSAFLLLIIVQLPIYETKIMEDENFVYEKLVTDNQNFSKSILLLGSSHVLTLNDTHIQQSLNEKFDNFHFINLGKNGDRPIKRVNDLDIILKEKPALVLYGVGFRDFSLLRPASETIFKQPESLLPDPKTFFRNNLFSLYVNLGNNFGFLESPKIITLQTIRNELQITLIEENKNLRQSNLIKSENELKNLIQLDPPVHEIPNFSINKDFHAISDLIFKLNQNNIDVIIFTTPHSKFYHDSIPEKSYNNFRKIIDELKKSYDLEVYHLDNKYIDLDIWRDNEHVAKNEKAIIFSNDILNILEKTIDP